MSEKKRRLTDLHTDIESHFLETYKIGQAQGVWREQHTKRILKYLDRIVEVTPPMKFVVTGCGPVPVTMRAIAEEGFDVTGIEPVTEYVENANEYLNGNGEVLKGWCENIPAEDDKFDVLFCESVLEHVDSPEKSLNEFYRVLKPGGVAYIATENRHRFSITGKNSEFNVRFYNFFPASVKEGYINKHLNVSPQLASYTPIPAVNWFTYSELCRLGRFAGFGKFYSLLDVMDNTDPKMKKMPFAKFILKRVRKNMWLRALFLSQRGGGTVFMYKRKDY